MNTCNKTGLAFILFFLMLVTVVISLPVIVTSDQVPLVGSSHTIPVYDSVNYKVQDTVEKEEINGRKYYISRPFGYLECTESSQVNLSIIKTYIDRVASDKAFIKGEIRNLDDKTIDIIVITFNLFNANGEQIGNAYASIDYLAPKATWKFSTEPITRTDFKFERYATIFTGVFI